MSEEKYSSQKIQTFLEKTRISTIGQLKRALGSKVRMTVLRKLSRLDYQTSYSHNGKFYTLKRLCEFDEHGLCAPRWNSVHYCEPLCQTKPRRNKIMQRSFRICVGEFGRSKKV